jgi:hypothetical protein
MMSKLDNLEDGRVSDSDDVFSGADGSTMSSFVVLRVVVLVLVVVSGSFFAKCPRLSLRCSKFLVYASIAELWCVACCLDTLILGSLLRVL